MAMQQLTLPGARVKKHNALVRSKLHIENTQASRVLASLIACIRTDDTEFAATYSLPIKNFMTDDSGRGYKNIKTTCKELLYAHAEIEETDQQGHQKLSLIPFFREINYSHGVVNAQFNQNMRGLLLQLRGFFTEYNLLEYLKLPSIYSQRIFEILKSWGDKPEVNISLTKLYEMLDTPESLHANFKDFRRRVLEKAHKDITQKTTLAYEWEAIKQGRAVVAVRFIFAQKRALSAAKKKVDDSKERQQQRNTKLGLAALACLKERGPACEGGHQKPAICEVCRKLR